MVTEIAVGVLVTTGIALTLKAVIIGDYHGSINKNESKPISFNDFSASYNLNPARWTKYNKYVQYEDGQYFYFKKYRDYKKYLKWLDKHCTAYEKLMYNMKQDLAMLPVHNILQEENIQNAIDIINKNYPNIDAKFKYLLDKQ